MVRRVGLAKKNARRVSFLPSRVSTPPLVSRHRSSTRALMVAHRRSVDLLVPYVRSSVSANQNAAFPWISTAQSRVERFSAILPTALLVTT
jgi:hypothetical protein